MGFHPASPMSKHVLNIPRTRSEHFPPILLQFLFPPPLPARAVRWGNWQGKDHRPSTPNCGELQLRRDLCPISASETARALVGKVERGTGRRHVRLCRERARTPREMFGKDVREPADGTPSPSGDAFSRSPPPRCARHLLAPPVVSPNIPHPTPDHRPRLFPEIC